VFILKISTKGRYGLTIMIELAKKLFRLAPEHVTPVSASDAFYESGVSER
jgi:DNA-binding IscR family transcriptional regulator